MEIEPRMTPQPECYTRMFVGFIIVHDQMQLQPRWSFAIYLLKKTNKLLVPMPQHTVTDHFPVEHVEGRKQRGRPVPFVIVCLRPTAPLLHRQSRLGSIQSLSLAFLIDTQNQDLIRRVQIKTHHILQFLNKMLVSADLERLDQMGLR